MSINIQFTAAHDCHLEKTRIDIWEFPLDKPFRQAKSLLNETELARANRYHFERHRRRFTIARATLRLILGRYLQQDGGQLSFQYNSHGKPGIRNSQGLEFNLSHSGELALLAVGCQFPLGVDLEFFSARPYDGIAKNLFSQQELEFFLTLPNHLKTHVFFQIWAQKEAFIKASGLGLSYPTKLFTVPIFSTTAERITDTVHHCEWLMNSFMPQVACSAALCHHPEVKKLRYARLDNPAVLF
ncbi:MULTISPECIES: 4'-phosphopantetheinyl transferase family protein [Legionella]|uniref:Phosphopantetheinyl transferase n=1 Tax=Legionella drozanskii LLAP-1 TaxID=1212489 RepID=A0A0W0SPX1_9GAMM|nr:MULTISPECIES: 4'-phosphopantetheinyl transferase superfamily protein [Legionella]KTC85392.1 phosphopantetheinyl transferase [Legionella drozanskii LLAP-1]PJE13949.1 MAG: phosphopantetheine-protein transferase [Legionella sp.]